MTARATGTLRFDRRVLGSLPRVIWPFTSTAVLLTTIRETADVDVCSRKTGGLTPAQTAEGTGQD